MFLRLADLGPGLSTSGDKGFVPRLARRWERRDPLTLVFELDPRARWHDGVPVTARDVVFTFERARNSRLSPQSASLLRRLRNVTAEGDYRVVARFSEPYVEQLYDVIYHVPPLPAHLLAQIPPDSLAGSAFMDRPIGSGPYIFVRRTPGQSLELAANPDFFLGRPGIRRVLLLIARDPEARVNLLLTEGVDALDNIYAFQNSARVEKLPAYQYYPVPGSTIQYADFNERDPADTSRSHPIFADPLVRRALAQAIDREQIGRGAYGPLARIPEGPLSALLLRNVDPPRPLPYDTAAARRLLASRGWLDRDRRRDARQRRAPARVSSDGAKRGRSTGQDGDRDAGGLAPPGHPSRSGPGRAQCVSGSSAGRGVRPRAAGNRAGPQPVGPGAELELRRKRQRGPLLQSGGRLAP